MKNILFIIIISHHNYGHLLFIGHLLLFLLYYIIIIREVGTQLNRMDRHTKQNAWSASIAIASLVTVVFNSVQYECLPKGLVRLLE